MYRALIFMPLNSYLKFGNAGAGNLILFTVNKFIKMNLLFKNVTYNIKNS